MQFGSFLEACKHCDAMWLIFSVARLNNLFLVLLKYQFGDFEWLQKSDYLLSYAI